MTLNPYESPQLPPLLSRFNAPAVFRFVAVWLGYALIGGLMFDQYFDAAAGHLPAWSVGIGGAAFVLSGLTLSGVYAWRAARGWTWN